MCLCVVGKQCENCEKRTGEGSMASAWSASLYGVWGVAPAGSRGTAPDQGVRGRSPPEADNILLIK
jgi:hypothetical protein